jgi:hypothetical protein
MIGDVRYLETKAGKPKYYKHYSFGYPAFAKAYWIVLHAGASLTIRVLVIKVGSLPMTLWAADLEGDSDNSTHPHLLRLAFDEGN